VRTFALSLVFAAGIAASAHAQDAWKTVTLDSGVSIDIPQGVGDAFKPDAEDAAKGSVLAFKTADPSNGDMYCDLDRLEYGKAPLGLVRRRAVDFFTNVSRAIFCQGVGAQVRVSAGDAVTSGQGYPGSRCVASYADTLEGVAEGNVVEAQLVLAPDAAYVLTCTVRGADQRKAEANWQGTWKARIAHMEESFKAKS
jgi:hypothetical protein